MNKSGRAGGSTSDPSHSSPTNHAMQFVTAKSRKTRIRLRQASQEQPHPRGQSLPQAERRHRCRQRVQPPTYRHQPPAWGFERSVQPFAAVAYQYPIAGDHSPRPASWPPPLQTTSSWMSPLSKTACSGAADIAATHHYDPWEGEIFPGILTGGENPGSFRSGRPVVRFLRRNFQRIG